MFPKFALAQYLFLGKSGKVEPIGLMKSNGKGYYLVKDLRQPSKTKGINTYRPGAVISDFLTVIAWASGNPAWRVQPSSKSAWKKFKIISMITVQEKGISTSLPSEDINLIFAQGKVNVVSTSTHASEETANDLSDAVCSIFRQGLVIEQVTDQGLKQTVLDLQSPVYTLPEIPVLSDEIWNKIPPPPESSLEDEVAEVFS